MTALVAALWLLQGCVPTGTPITLPVRGAAPDEGVPRDISEEGFLFSQADRATFDETVCVGIGAVCQVQIPAGKETRIVLAYSADERCELCHADVDVSYEASPLEPLLLELACEITCWV